MLLKNLIAAAGVAGTLGAAAPAFADWYQPAPPIVVAPPMPVYGYPGVYYRHDWDGDRARDYWRWRHRHEWREREWQGHAWREHHRRWDRW
jgi:hypothetical protein